MILWNHRPEAVWQMTPQQVAAWVSLGHDREAADRANRLADGFGAARGEPREVERTIRELMRG